MSTLHRSRKAELRYRDYLKHHVHAKNICVFCDIEEGSSQIIKEYTLFRVITNAFPYTLWDSCTVTEHSMIVPIQHVQSMSKFTKQEFIEYDRIVAAYEKNGYDIYTRGASSSMKSIPHQHTHLIKTDNKKIKSLFYIDKPLVHKIVK